MFAIRKMLENGGYRNPEADWDIIIQEGIDAMIRMEKATKDFVKDLKI